MTGESMPFSDGSNRGPIVRTISLYERAVTEDDTAYILWREGPRANEVYDVVQRPSDAALQALPRMTEIEEQLTDKLHHAQTSEGAQSLLAYMYELSYGTDGQVGLQTARLFDLDGEGAKYHAFIKAFEEQDRWQYFEDFAAKRDIKGAQFLYPNRTILKRHAATAHAGLVPLFYEELPDADETSVGLMHHTLGCTLPAAVEMDGLLSCDRLAENGLTKSSGEDKWDRGSGPEYVYLWPNRSYNRDFVPFTTWHGLDYPIVWGINHDRLANLEASGQLAHEAGDWQTERRVFGSVALRSFTNLWVPPFAVEQHDRILKRHGYDTVTVAPLQLKAFA